MKAQKAKGNCRFGLWLIPIPLLAVLAAGLLFLLHRGISAPPTLVEKESFFSNFMIQGDSVYFLCRLTVYNPEQDPVAVQITGDFSADVKGGLLREPQLLGYELDKGLAGGFLSLGEEELSALVREDASVILLQPGNNNLWLVFVGPLGESTVKQDRLLPPIAIQQADSDR